MLLGVKSINWIQRKSKLIVASFAVAALISGGVPLFAAHAENSQTYVVVGNSEFTLTNVTSPLKVSTTPYTINAKIRSLNQVQVYVDNILADTIPLTLTDTDLTYNLTVDPGEHEVKFVGISPTGTDPSSTIAVEYTAASGSGSTPEPLPAATSASGQSVDASNGAVSEPRPLMESIRDFYHNALITLDFAKPGDTAVNGKMMARFLLLTAGLSAVAFAPWVLGLYRTVRYSWLHLPAGPVPKGISKHPVASIRWIGVALILFVLLLL